MSHLNLICGGHVESAASNGNLDANKSEGSPSHAFKSARDEFTRHIPAHKLRHSSKTKQSKGAQKNAESFPMKVHRSTDTSNLDSNLLHDDYGRNYSPDDKDHDYRRRHVVNDNRGYTSDPPSPPIVDKPPEYSQVLQGPDHLTRPTSLNTQPGQIIFCSSLDQMKENMYRSMVPTLVIPAHYMRLSSEFGATDQGKDGANQVDRDGQSSQGTTVGFKDKTKPLVQAMQKPSKVILQQAPTRVVGPPVEHQDRFTSLFCLMTPPSPRWTGSCMRSRRRSFWNWGWSNTLVPGSFHLTDATTLTCATRT